LNWTTKARRRGTVITVSFAALLSSFAAVPAVAAAKTITVSGSTSVAPLMTLLARKYVRSHDNNVGFKILQGGSDVGVADVGAGRVTVGMSSRDPKASDPGGLVFNRIAYDAICLITSKQNTLAGVNQSQVQDIFSGTIRDWSAVPGATVGGTIDVNVRTAASGTQDAFDKIFMAGKKTFSGASQKASNGLVQQSVASTPGAIGYVSLAFTQGVNTLSYNGVPCNLRNAKSGQYGGRRSFYLVTQGEPKGAFKKVLAWILHNKKASKVIAKEWVPLH
jgi:phosphate transport system substrate-binding protein